jgi:hypothetical protein
MGKAACPKCRIVFDSDLEYRIHYSHSHYGPVPAPLVQSVPVADVAKVETVPAVADVTGVTDVADEAPYSLAASREGLGELSPVLKDAHGNVIDGFHRLGENANWHSIIVPTIDDPVKLELARLAVNYNRRKVAPEELTQRITFLVKAGLKPEEIAKQTGISLRTVYKYMPQELKEPARVERGSIRNQSSPSRQNTESLTANVQFTNVKVAEPASTPSTLSTPHIEPKPEIAQFEPEVIPEGTPICPVCEASMNLSEYQEIKRKIKTKYGLQIQTLLFPQNFNQKEKVN